MKQSIVGLVLSVVLVPGALWAQNNFEQQKKAQDDYLKRLEQLQGVKRMEDVIRITLKDGSIIATCPLVDGKQKQVQPKQYRVALEGFEREFTLSMFSNPANAMMPWNLTMSRVDYPDLAGTRNLHINLQPNYFQISYNFHNNRNSYQNVTFVQTQGRSMFGQPDGVQLSVNKTEEGRNNLNVNLQASDFDSFRRMYPREMTQYVRPLFRDLRLEGLYTVEPIIVWQVFSEQWAGDAELQKEIGRLLPALNSEVYRERQAASAKLLELGPFGALQIYLMPRKGLSIEQHNRLDAVLGAYSFLSREMARKSRQDQEFLLDCLLSEDARLRQFALDQLQRVAGQAIKFDNKADKDARASRVSQLRDQLVKPTPKK